jgi:hypothetical protein
MAWTAIDYGIHICPSCSKDFASGVNAITGKPQICNKCIAWTVRMKEARKSQTAPVADADIAEGDSFMGMVWFVIGCIGVVAVCWLAGGFQ